MPSWWRKSATLAMGEWRLTCILSDPHHLATADAIIKGKMYCSPPVNSNIMTTSATASVNETSMMKRNAITPVIRETPASAAVAPTMAYGPVVMQPLRSGHAARITLFSRFALFQIS